MSESAFRQSLVDASTVISVLLAFLSVVFGLKYEHVARALNEALPAADRPDDRASFRQRQRRCLFVDVAPIGVPSLLLTLLLAPASFRIISGSQFAYLDLDLVKSLFIAVNLSFVALAIWSVAVSVLLSLRARKA